MKKRMLVAVVASLGLMSIPSSIVGQQPAPAFNTSGELVRPPDYRAWVFLTSGLGMTYGPAQPAAGRPPLFDNVFVTREAYTTFLQSGRWPDKTMFILEGRRAET